MRRVSLATTFAALAVMLASPGLAQQNLPDPYKVLKRANVGGEGGFDYIFADVDGRRLYVPRSGPMGRLSVYNLDTLESEGEIANVSSGGAIVDPRSHHGFSTTKPLSMWDTNTLTVVKTIEVQGRPDGMMFDSYNERVWILSHVAPNATVIDAKDGSVVATLDLGGAPEQAVTDGRGKIYVNIEDKNKIAVVDAKTLTVTASYDLSSKGIFATGLAFDTKNHILFSYLRQPTSVAVILSANDGKIITTLPTGNGVDTVAFNASTMEAISTDGIGGSITVIKENSPTSFFVEQTLPTMRGARTMALDTKTNRVLTMTGEFGPAPPPPDEAHPAQPPNLNARNGPMVPGSFTLLMVGR